MQAKRTFLLHPEWILAVLITTAACVLHYYYWRHVGGLWRDEVNLVDVSQRRSFIDMAKDSFPILMPLLVHMWRSAGLGDSDLHLRLTGLLLGLGTLAALWISSWKIRRAPPLIGLVLLGLNVTVILAGDSLRAYGLGSLLAVALTASGFFFLQNPSGQRVGWLILFAVLSVQVLYQNAVLVAAVCFGAWVVCWRRQDGRAALQVLLVAVVSAASLLPYAPTLMGIAGGSRVLRTGIELRHFLANLTGTFGYPRWDYIYLWVLLYGLIIFNAIAGSETNISAPAKTKLTSSNLDLSLFAAILLALESIGLAIFLLCAQIPIEGWYILPFMGSAVVCFDAALPLCHWIWRTGLLVFVAVTACLSIPHTGRIVRAHFSNMDICARQLTAAASPKDYVLVCPWYCGITFANYFKGTTLWDTLPPISDHSVHRFDLVQLQLQNTNAITPLLGQITQTLQAGHRVWILVEEGRMHVPATGTRPPLNLPPAPLPDTGWADAPYTRVWTFQVACLLVDHSTNFEKLKNFSTERFLAENMSLFVANGWKTNSPVQ